ncbi:MAG: ABC transporter permease [Promethearchaeota archaeon]
MDQNKLFSLTHIIDVLSNDITLYFLYWDTQQALITTILCVLIGLPGSYILAHYRFPAKSFLRNLLTVPFILPPIVVLFGFIAVFGRGGWINQFWMNLTGSLLIDIYATYVGIILAHVFYNIPVIIRLTEIGWKNIDPEIVAVARSLKASKWRIFWKIQFPQLLPILAAASLLVFIYAFNSFAIVLYLGDPQFQTLEVRIFWLARWSEFNAAAALTLIQIFINILLIILYLYYSNKYEVPTAKFPWELEKPLISYPFTSRSLLKLVSIASYFIIIGTICVLPILGVFLKSITSLNGTFSLENYTQLFDVGLRSYIGLLPQAMMTNSFIFGIGVMLLAPILALLLNHGLHYETTHKGTPKLSTMFQSVGGIIIILPLAVSSITLAFSLYSIYHSTAIYDNIALAIIIAQTLIAFPFANRIIAATRANIDPTIVNVARSLGASRLKVFAKIELPILLPGIIVAGLFSFAISIGEFGATYFLARSNFATIPVGIYRLIDTRHIGAAYSFSAILMIISILSFMIIERIGQLEFRF